MALPTLRRRAAAVIGAALAFSASAVAIDKDWILDDLDKAKAMAAEQGKDLLIDFTGSDWCVWCKRLDGEVFAQSQFKEEAPKNFILVALDYPSPNGPKQTEEVKTANQAHQAKYQISGFPTVILANAKGEAYARTGYRPDGAGPYLEHLGKLREGRDKRDSLLADAKAAEGVERAKLLDQAITIQDIMVPNRDEIMSQIIALDADNEAGLKERYEQQLIDSRIQGVLAQAQQKMGAEDFAAAEAMLASVVDADRASDEVRGELQMARVSIMYFQKKYAEMSTAIETMMTDEKLPIDMRMQMSLARLEYAIMEKDMAMAESIMDATLALGPDSQMGMMLGAQREQILASVRQRMEETPAPAVPHDHDGDGKPDH